MSMFLVIVEDITKFEERYGVPPQLLGIPGDSTYANYREARAALWEDTVLYYLNYIKTELNNWMFGKDSDEFIDFNLDNIPALAYKRDKLWERAQKSDFLTLNEKREMTGHEKKGPEGDVIVVQASMTTLDDIVNGPAEEDQTEEDKKLIKELQESGYSEDEINSMLGFSYGEKG